MFGNLFNELQVDRFDSSGTKIQTVNVPIEYGPKQKFIRRLQADPTLLKEVSIVVPRLGFEFSSMSYAPARKLNTGHKFVRGVSTTGNQFDYTYAPVPYDLNFSLYAFVKNAEDGAQIVEQIVPFFTPDWTVSMKVLPEMDLVMDVPIELSSIISTDEYEGDFDTKRILTWQMDFIIKGYLFGPVKKYKYIANADVNTKINLATISVQSFEGDSEFGFVETITE